MDSIKFHSDNEQKINQLSEVVRLAKIGGFSKSVADKLVKTTEATIDCLVKIRQEVYQDLEGAKNYDHQYPETEVTVIDKKESADTTEFQIRNTISSLKSSHAKTPYVLNRDLKKLNASDNFKKNEIAFEAGLDKIVECFDAKSKPEDDVKPKSDAKSKAKADAEAKKKLDAEAKAKADEEARLKKEADAKKKADLEEQTRLKEEEDAQKNNAPVKIKLTEEDLVKYPELVAEGLKAGDEVDALPEEKNS